MRLDLYKKDFDTIPAYTSFILPIFEKLTDILCNLQPNYLSLVYTYIS